MGEKSLVCEVGECNILFFPGNAVCGSRVCSSWGLFGSWNRVYPHQATAASVFFVFLPLRLATFMIETVEESF
jgi:hypothetical protein